jgi:hypothetical protein
MKRLLLLIAVVCLCALPVHAQQLPPIPSYYTGAQQFSGTPTGGCQSYQLAVNTTNGALYTCSGGSWTAVGGGGTVAAHLFADQFSGSDASVKINACITAVIALGGGTCDASNLSGSQTMSTQINVGGGSGNLVSSNGNLLLILPATAVWNWTITNGTSCGIMQYTNTVIQADNPNGDFAGTQLGAASGSTNMDSLYCTQPSPTELGNNLSNVKAMGFLAANYNGGTFANGVIHIQNVSDESYFSLGGLNYTGDAWHVSNVCCATTIDRSFGDSGQPGSSQVGGNVLTINGGGNGGNNLIISKSTFNGPGVGHYNVFINPSVNTYSIQFVSDYFEKYGSDTTTPMIYIGADAINTQFIGGQIINNCASSCNQYAFENHATAGWSVQNVNYGFFSTTGVNDINGGRTWTTDGFTVNAGSGTVNQVPMSYGGASLTSNIALGSGVLPSDTSGAFDVGVGFQALNAEVSGSENTAVGYKTLNAATSFNNTAVGYEALTLETTGPNTAVGSSSLASDVTGNKNTALGYTALNADTASNNTAVGDSALALNTSGGPNTAVGASALGSNLTGSHNTAVGYQALLDATSFNGTAVGDSALATTTGAANTALGSTAGQFISSGQFNTAVGFAALLGITGTPTSGSNNTAFGASALTAVQGAGNGNTAVGSSAGDTITTGTDDTLLGDNVQANAATDTNETVIGFNQTGAGSNTTVIGNGSVTDTYLGGTNSASISHVGAERQNGGNSFGSFVNYGASSCETGFGATTVSGGATTTTGLTCLPANAIIDAVVYRVTTTITTATTFTIGDSGSATRYCATQSNMSAGATGTCTAAGFYLNPSALGVKITPSTTPGAGAIRLIVYYHTWTAPTS